MNEGSPHAVTRLPHGYTNVTSRIDGIVRKSYLGPDPELRRSVERSAITGLAGIFPVPGLYPSPDGELWMREIPGRPGQEVMTDGRAGAVLRLCGQTRRRLSEIDASLVPGLSGQGKAIVHGDFGPQNLLLTAEGDSILAVIDWELAHLGSPVEDLAWTEWIVRMHHPEIMDDLGQLFVGFGSRPPWHERQELMLTICRKHLDFCRRWEDPVAVELWGGAPPNHSEIRGAVKRLRPSIERIVEQCSIL